MRYVALTVKLNTNHREASAEEEIVAERLTKKKEKHEI